MKIAIARKGNEIAVLKDYEDLDSKGEVSHMLAEIEIIKLELLDLWQKLG